MQVKYCVKKYPKYLLANLVHCIKKGTNFGGHRVIVFNLARPTRYPWYKEKFPALKDTYIQIYTNYAEKKGFASSFTNYKH